MKKIGVILLIALLLVPVLAAPADAWRGGRGGFRHHGGGGGRFAGGLFLGLGVGALLTAPWWYAPPAYAYPVYSPYPVYYPAYAPAYPPPAYGAAYGAPAYTPTYPTPEAVSSAPQGAMQPAPAPPSGSQPPAAQPPQAAAQNCQMVWIEGHYETRVTADGQRFTSWIPSYQQQVCQ